MIVTPRYEPELQGEEYSLTYGNVTIYLTSRVQSCHNIRVLQMLIRERPNNKCYTNGAIQKFKQNSADS